MPAMLGAVLGLILALGAGATAPATDDAETRISLDVRDAEITDIVRVLSEVAGLQVVFDPGLTCRLTLKLKDVHWRAALDASLRACALGQEDDGGVLRIAPV